MSRFTPKQSSGELLKSHLTTLNQQIQITPQVGYSLACLAQALDPHNSQKLQHLEEVSQHRSKILSLASNSKGLSQQNLLNLLRVINSLQKEKKLEKEEEMMVLSAVASINAVKGELNNELCEELRVFCSLLGRGNINNQLLLKHITGVMSAKQMKIFLQNLQAHQLQQTSLDDLIELAKQYPSESQILIKVLQAIHWWSRNNFSHQSDPNSGKKAALFLGEIAIANIQRVSIVSLCSLTYKQLTKKAGKLLPESLDSFLNKDFESPMSPAYLPTLQKGVTEEDLKLIIENNGHITSNLPYQYLLNYYAQSFFPWNQNFQSYQTKKILEKQFLLRINEKVDSPPRLNQSLDKEEVSYAGWLPVPCMRTIEGLIRKVQISGPFEAMEVVSVMQKINRTHPRFQELLIMLVEKMVQHRDFQSLRQVQRVVLSQVDSKTVVEKLKEKSSVHQKDSNRQSKKYFALVPLLLTKTQTEIDVGDELGNIFGFQTVSIRLKLYVANFLLKKMVEKPLQKFIAVLSRQLQSSEGEDTLNALHWYLKDLQNLNKTTLEWVALHFSESGQRLLELIFSMLMTSAAKSAAKTLFLLQKLGVYNRSWLHVYRWVLLALEQSSEDQLILDCLELFQMLLEKVGQTLPKGIAERFERIVSKNWNKYTHNHLFTIQRIVELLNQSSLMNVKKIPIPNLSDLLRDQQIFESSSNLRFNEIDPITKYFKGLSWNLVFQQVDSSTAIKGMLSLFSHIQSKDQNYPLRVVSALQIILYVYEDEENVVQADVDQFVSSLIQNYSTTGEETQWWKVWSLCLEFLSRVPHSINILKLPLADLLKRGFNDGQWISFINDLLEIVVESKPKAIGNFKLQQNLKLILIKLIALEGPLVEQYLDLLDLLCSQEGDYQNWLGQNLKLLERILIAQGQGVGYRASLVGYVLENITDYDYDLQNQTVWKLFNKYACDHEIVLCLLNYLELKGVNGSFDQELLMRLVLTHTQNEQIQQKCRTLFNTNAPPSNIEKKFTQALGEGNYSQCEQLLPKIGNPFSLTFSIPEIRGLLEWKNAATSAKKLLKFLSQHPDAYLKMHSCQALYLNHDYLPFLAQTLSTLSSDPSLQKFQGNPPSFTLKVQPVSKVIYQTVTSMIRNKSVSQSFKSYLTSSFKQTEDAVSVLSELLTIVFRIYLKEENHNNFLTYYHFFREVVGQWQLLSLDKVIRYNLRQLIYLFPYQLGDLNPDKLPDVGLLSHYLSLMENHRIIKNELGFDKYLEKVRKALLGRAQSNVHGFIENYMKTHIQLQNHNEWTLEKNQQQQTVHLSMLEKLRENSNRYLQTQMNDPSTKLDYLVLLGYLTTILHGHEMSLQLDPPSVQRLSVIDQSIDNYSIAEENKNIIKEGLKWLLKGVKPVSLPQKGPTSPPRSVEPAKEPPYQSIKYQSIKSNKPLPSPSHSKNEDIGVLSLYASMRPTTSEELDEVELKKDAQEAYIRYKEREQNVTIKETITEHNTEIIILDIPAPAINIEDSIMKDEKHVEESKVCTISEEQRQSNLDSAQKIKQQFSIHSLKDHCKFIASLADLPTISPSQHTQLLHSVDQVRLTVQSHTFYVKKVLDNQTVYKLIKIYKTLFAQKGEYKTIGTQTLRLCLSMAEKKQKKLVLFNDEESIHFFKMFLKRALNKDQCVEELTYLIGTLYLCRNNTENYFTTGLFSMVVELVNRDIMADQVIDYLIRIDLSASLINQIYQRGLLNKLMKVVAIDPKTQEERTLLNLWVKLAGKVCINKSIQERFRSKQLHSRVWELFKDSINPAELLNLSFFYAYLCIKNEAICEWMMQNRILEDILSILKTQPLNDEIFLMFYHFCFSNQISRDHCFRLKYHQYLLERLTMPPPRHLTKHFFKSLGQMMSSRLHIPIFFKEEAVSKLIDHYNQKSEPAVYECLLDFISTLETQPQFEELKRQRFWQSLKLFEYKVSNEATYSYLLQIFLVMIKKDRTRQFNQPEVRSKVCLKSQYSINMEGKELALRFILALSIKNKQNYFNQRCIKILGSVLGLKVSQTELQLTNDILKIEGITKNQALLAAFTHHNIHTLIIDALPTLPKEEVHLALSILTNFCFSLINIKKICEKGAATIMKCLENTPTPNTLKEGLKLLAALAYTKENQKDLIENRIIDFLKTSALLSSVNTNQLQPQYSELLGNLASSGILSSEDVQEITRISQISGVAIDKKKYQMSVQGQEKSKEKVEKAITFLRQGKKVKMYKTDGSVSQLILFISSDTLELNCATKQSEIVKQKWRLPINQIVKSVTFNSQDSPGFLNSLFEKNSGFFTKTPDHDCCLILQGRNNTFYICFASQLDRDEWSVNFDIARKEVKIMLQQLRQH